MPLSNLTALDRIAERSDATPGLWNRLYDATDANFASVQSLLNSASGLSARNWSTNLETTTGLTYGYAAGPALSIGVISSTGSVISGGTAQRKAAGTVALTASQTNYIERTYDGVVSANTLSFSTVRIPMAKVVTGAAAITSIEDWTGAYGPLPYYPPLSGESGVLDLRWPVGHPRRYGALGDATTDDTASVQSAIYAARKVGAPLEVTYGRYLVTSALDFTFKPSDTAATKRSITIRCSATAAPGISPDTGCFIVAHEDHVFDCTGSSSFIWEDVNVQVKSGHLPKTCWFMSRNTRGDNCGQSTFIRPAAYGAFANAIVYGYGAEENDYISPRFTNTRDNGALFLSTGMNISGLTSAFISVITGTQSNLVGNVFGGSLAAQAIGGKVFYFEGATGWSVNGPWLRAGGGASAASCFVYVDTSQGESNDMKFKNCLGEIENPQADYGFYFGDSVRTCRNWTIEDCRIPSTFSALFAHDNVELDNLRYDANNEPVTRGISINNLTNSFVRAPTALINIRGISKRNTLIGDSTRFTVSTRSADIWLDTFSGAVNASGAVVSTPGSALTPGHTFTSELSLGLYRSGASTMAASYGTLNLATNAVRLSMRTLAASAITLSAAKTNVAVDEVVLTIGGASGASLAVYSGGTVYLFNSALSAKAT